MQLKGDFNGCRQSLHSDAPHKASGLFVENYEFAQTSQIELRLSPEPERKRHLLRLWLSIDGKRPIPDILAERTQGGIVTRGTKLHAPLEAE